MREEKRRKGGVMEKRFENRNYMKGLKTSLSDYTMQYLYW